jgi:conjugal transfer pilus assembly protein TraV
MKRSAMQRAAAMTFGVAASMALLSACTSLSGVSGASEYACKAPEGVTCQSVSGTYANAAADNLPASRKRPAAPQGSPAAPAPSAPIASTPTSLAPTTFAGLPLRSSPLILRLWFKPWEDADGDLFDQGHVYVQVNGGRWLVEHAQRAIREAHAPVRAAAAPGSSVPPPPAGMHPHRPINHPTQPTLPGRPAIGGDARE